MSEYPYWIVDVFCAAAFGGNPLAVIPAAEGLSSEQMQHIAREFNFSETTFVLPPANPENTAHFRIFTPSRELPFAGHPTLGTAWVIGQEQALPRPAELRLEAGVGLLKVRLEADAARFQVALQPKFSALETAIADLARLLGLSEQDIAAQPVIASCGLPFALVPLTGLDAIGRARLSLPLDDPLFSDWPVLKELYLYCHQTVSAEPDLHTRMFAPGAGVAEDPATGSAASALAAWLASRQPDGCYELEIEQGIEMGRPSRIKTRVEKRDEQLQVFVSGQVRPFSRGVLWIH